MFVLDWTRSGRRSGRGRKGEAKRVGRCVKGVIPLGQWISHRRRPLVPNATTPRTTARSGRGDVGPKLEVSLEVSRSDTRFPRCRPALAARPCSPGERATAHAQLRRKRSMGRSKSDSQLAFENLVRLCFRVWFTSSASPNGGRGGRESEDDSFHRCSRRRRRKLCACSWTYGGGTGGERARLIGARGRQPRSPAQGVHRERRLHNHRLGVLRAGHPRSPPRCGGERSGSRPVAHWPVPWYGALPVSD